jgi:hypothetical protein
MKTLSYKQLAFILDIPAKEALEKIISVYCKTKAMPTPAPCDTVTEYLYDFNEAGNKVGRNHWPDSLEVELLASYLNLPTLQQYVEDIRLNFLKRPASKKWILSDFPEKQLQTKERHKIKIPSVLASLLKDSDLSEIKSVWREKA